MNNHPELKKIDPFARKRMEIQLNHGNSHLKTYTDGIYYYSKDPTNGMYGMSYRCSPSIAEFDLKRLNPRKFEGAKFMPTNVVDPMKLEANVPRLQLPYNQQLGLVNNGNMNATRRQCPGRLEFD